MKTLEPLTADMLQETAPGQFNIKGGLLTELVYAFPESILFLSSMLSSVWLWMYFLGYMAMYAAVRLDRVGRWARERLDIGRSPSQAIAMAVVIASTAICAGILVIHAIARGLLGMLR